MAKVILEDIVTNVTNTCKYNFINYVVGTGQIPEQIQYAGDIYELNQQDKDKYIYSNDDCYYISIIMPSYIVDEAKSVYKKVSQL